VILWNERTQFQKTLKEGNSMKGVIWELVPKASARLHAKVLALGDVP